MTEKKVGRILAGFGLGSVLAFYLYILCQRRLLSLKGIWQEVIRSGQISVDMASIRFFSIILPVGLSAIGYVAGQAASPAVAKGLSGIMCLASGICVLLSCVIIFCGYHLTEKKVTELTEIVEKRQAEKHE